MKRNTKGDIVNKKRKGKEGNNKKRTNWKQKAIEDENKELTNLLFGSAMTNFQNDEKVEDSKIWNSVKEHKSAAKDEDDDIESLEPKKKSKKLERNQQVWNDSDEEDETINLVRNSRTIKLRKTEEEKRVTESVYEDRLRSQFEATQVQNSDWAKLPQEDEEKTADEEIDDLLRSAKSLLKTKSSTLPKGLLGITQLRDVNSAERNNVFFSFKLFYYYFL